jgi:hypothetical protein
MSRILSLSTSSILFLTCICSAQTNSLKSNFENEFFRSARNSFFMAQQENPIISAGENNFYKPVQAVIDNSVRYNYSYTPEGLSCKLSEVLISGSWEPVRRETSEYNSNGLLSGVLYEDMVNGIWIPNSKLSYTYNAAGQLDTYLAAVYLDSISTILFLTNYSYQSGLVTEVLSQYKEDDSWINLNKVIYSYTPEGKNETMIYQLWRDTDWANWQRFNRLYDTHNRLTEFVNAEWDSAWVNKTRYLFYYNSSDKVCEKVYELWTINWTKSEKEIYIYNEAGKTDTIIQQVWQDMEWNNSGLFINSYDIGWNRIEELFYQWNNLEWMQKGRLGFEYDAHNNGIKADNYQWQSGWIPATRYFFITYNNGLESISFNAKSVVVQYDIFTSAGQEEQSLLSKYLLSDNYPNPFNPSTTINFSVPEQLRVKITLFNILGREIRVLFNDIVPAGEHKLLFNAAGLSSGVYLYQMNAGNFKALKKMVIIR